MCARRRFLNIFSPLTERKTGVQKTVPMGSRRQG